MVHHRDTFLRTPLSLDMLQFSFHPWEWTKFFVQFLHHRPMKNFSHMAVIIVSRNFKRLSWFKPSNTSLYEGYFPNGDVDLTRLIGRSIHWFKGYKLFGINRQLGRMFLISPGLVKTVTDIVRSTVQFCGHTPWSSSRVHNCSNLFLILARADRALSKDNITFFK